MGKVLDCTKTNISNMIKGEMGSNKMKAELEELYTFIDHASRDEARHASMLNGMLDRL
jgi:hypothetical protein